MPRHLLSINDLDVSEIQNVLEQARIFRQNSTRTAHGKREGHLVGLVFLEPSLRTRVGFASACARLGWQSVIVSEQRASEISVAESLSDTVRVVSGMVDILVARLRAPIGTVTNGIKSPLINGGDRGRGAEHPTQALVDLFAIEKELGSIERLHVAICGDLRSRAARSLLRVLQVYRPSHLSLVYVPELDDEDERTQFDRAVTSFASLQDVSDADVLYMVGIPHRAVPDAMRAQLRLTARIVEALPRHAIVLSPMPVIDEISTGARINARIRMLEQSDDSVFVRMAILRLMMGNTGSSTPG